MDYSQQDFTKQDCYKLLQISRVLFKEACERLSDGSAVNDALSLTAQVHGKVEMLRLERQPSIEYHHKLDVYAQLTGEKEAAIVLENVLEAIAACVSPFEKQSLLLYLQDFCQDGWYDFEVQKKQIATMIEVNGQRLQHPLVKAILGPQ